MFSDGISKEVLKKMQRRNDDKSISDACSFSLSGSSRGPRIRRHTEGNRLSSRPSPIQEVGKTARKCVSTLPFMSDSTTKRKWSAAVFKHNS